MPGLLLHEQRVRSVLDQVRDIRVTQAVHRQLGGQAGRLPPGREPVIDLPQRDPPAPLGQPQRRVPGGPEAGLTSSVYCASASAVHGITVATARRRGGLPRIALPYRT